MSGDQRGSMKPVPLFTLFMLLAVSTVSISAAELEFRLVDGGGQPVKWGQNSVYYREMKCAWPVFKAGVPEGTSTLLNLFVLECRGEMVRSLSPAITITGSVATCHVDGITRSLRVSRNLCWAEGALYVAEEISSESSNGCLSVMGSDGLVSRRLSTVSNPRAVAVAGGTAWVANGAELASLQLADGRERYRVSCAGGVDISQIAVLGAHVYVGDRKGPALRVFEANTGKELPVLLGPDRLRQNDDLSGIGVAATREGTLIVSDSEGVREFAVEGGAARLVRERVKVPGGMAVAVDRQGNIAVAVPASQSPLSAPTPEVWKYDAMGKPVQRLVRVYMRGPADSDNTPADSLYKLRVFGGLDGSLRSPGGVAFDDAGRLYVSDSLRFPSSKTRYYADSDRMEMDGGVVRFSADGELEVKLGSRYTDGKAVAERLAARAHRPPLLRTAEAFTKGRLSLLAWGDSISSCGGDWNGGATQAASNWVHVLSRHLEGEHKGLKVSEVADGVGGQNVAESLCRDPSGLAARNVNPDLILLELGTNDQGFRMVTVAQFAKSWRRMLTQLIVTTDSDLVMITPGPLPDAKAVEPPGAYIRAMQEVGREFNVPVVDMTAGVNQVMAAQKLAFTDFHNGPKDCHPNNRGHAVWAGVVAETILRAK